MNNQEKWKWNFGKMTNDKWQMKNDK